MLTNSSYETILDEVLGIEGSICGYYDPQTRAFSFISLDDGEQLPQGAYALPSKELMESLFKMTYRNYLTEDERQTLMEIEQSKEEFSFRALRQSGIYDRVMAVILENELNLWAAEHELQIDWNNI